MRHSKYLLILLGFLFWVSPAHAAIVFVNSAGTNVNTVSLSVNVSSTNLLVVSCFNTNGVAFTAPSDTAGDTFTKAASINYGSAGFISTWYAINTSANTSTVACPFDGNSPSINVTQYSGTAQTSPLDAVTTSTQTYNSTVTSPAFSTTYGGDVAYYAAFGSGGDLTNCTATDIISNTFNARTYQPTGKTWCSGDSIFSSSVSGDKVTAKNGGSGEYWAFLTASFKPAAVTYLHYRSITVTSTASSASGTNTNFPMLFGGTYTWLEASSSGGKIQNLVTAPNGGQEPADLIFTTSTPTVSGSAYNCGNSLNFETESYASSTGVINDWVQMPTISTGTVIYACYDSTAQATDQSSPTGVWNSNFAGVYHLANPTSTIQGNDSTINVFNGVVSGPPIATSSGQIDGAGVFGPSNYGNFNMGAVSGLILAGSSFSLSAWVYQPSSAGGSVAGNWGSGNVFYLMTPNSTTECAVYSGGYNVLTGASMPTNQWVFLDCNEDGTYLTSYLNGAYDTKISSGNVGSGGGPSSKFVIGDQSSGGSGYDGNIDEVEVSNVSRSASWIATEYYNQLNPSNFLTIGAEQSAGGGGGASNAISQLLSALGAGILNVIGNLFGKGNLYVQ